VVPLGYVNLDKNIFVQVIAVVSVITMAILWMIDFARIGFESRLHVWNSNQDGVLVIFKSISLFNREL
jgi:hypothetical protein